MSPAPWPGSLRMIQLSFFPKFSTLVFLSVGLAASRGSVNPLLESGKGLVLGLLHPSDKKLGTSALVNLMETDNHP